MAVLLKLELGLDDLAPEDVNRLLLVQILGNLHNFKEQIMASIAELQAKLDTLSGAVAGTTDVVQGTHTLITGLVQMIADLRAELANLGVPQAVLDQVDNLTQTVNSMKGQLSKDVVDNTPAA